MASKGGILILDFGSQYTQLIARRLRELEILSEILPYSTPLQEILNKNPKGLILSGGPASVHKAGSPKIQPAIVHQGIPILGICYGMQLLAAMHGNRVQPARKREYGQATLSVLTETPLFQGLPQSLTVWMSHGDGIGLHNGFTTLAKTDTAPYAAIAHASQNLYGVQFHPEVAHTPLGSRILENFARHICRIEGRWTMAHFLAQSLPQIREQAGKDRVLCALSGGVDSSVTAMLLHRAIGKQLFCIFVDTGLLREGDREWVESFFSNRLGLNLKQVDARRRFLKRLQGVSDPERKRKVIGREFVRVFEAEARKIRGVRILAQGTLYPDVIESVSVHGPSSTIKSHHNVGGLPQRMKLRLLEPLRFLFKDEVRRLGQELGLPKEILQNHPFPGPGLAVRILGPATSQRLQILRRADAIILEEIRSAGFYEKLWQAFAVLLPLKTVGVMGDQRTYEQVIALRAVESSDGMTADWSRLPHEILGRISNRIINEVRGINRVVYDISSKPPATIEWE